MRKGKKLTIQNENIRLNWESLSCNTTSDKYRNENSRVRLESNNTFCNLRSDSFDNREVKDERSVFPGKLPQARMI